MASIYNETILKLYEERKLYKSSKSYWGKREYWSKNCSYGYAHYNPKTKEFEGTMGWKGIKQLYSRFKITINEKEYLRFMKHYKLKYNWIYTLSKTDLHWFYKDIEPYIILAKATEDYVCTSQHL